MKFLLLAAIVGLAALADSANVLGLPEIPGLANLLPKGKRDVPDLSSVVANLLQNPDFVSQFLSLLQQFGGQKHLPKRDIFGLLPGGDTPIGLPGGFASDIAAGGKMAAKSIKADLGKVKRQVGMDLLNMLIGNFEGAMTGMDIAR